MTAAERPEVHDCDWPSCRRPAFTQIRQGWYCGEHAPRVENLSRSLTGVRAGEIEKE